MEWMRRADFARSNISQLLAKKNDILQTWRRAGETLLPTTELTTKQTKLLNKHNLQVIGVLPII